MLEIMIIYLIGVTLYAILPYFGLAWIITTIWENKYLFLAIFALGALLMYIIKLALNISSYRNEKIKKRNSEYVGLIMVISFMLFITTFFIYFFYFKIFVPIAPYLFINVLIGDDGVIQVAKISFIGLSIINCCFWYYIFEEFKKDKEKNK